MFFRYISIMLVCAALGTLLPSVTQGGRIPVYPEKSDPELDSHLVFETSFSINELPSKRWTPAQQKEIDYLLERMKRDDRIFLVVKTVVDPIGSREENEKWALGISREVGKRLMASGVRPDRILIVPGEEDTRLFDADRWEEFVPLQKVYIRAFQGRDWLRRRESHAAVREDLPTERRTRIPEPSEGKTDRASQLLRGVTDPTVRSVTIVPGGKSQTVAVYAGWFEAPISLHPEKNRILVTGLDKFGSALLAYLTFDPFAGSPSRETVHRFDPIKVSPENRNVPLVPVSLPEGTILDRSKQ
jgi:hypothetical protein